MKKLFLCIILLAACCRLAVAQKNKVDSLTTAYKKTGQDTTLVLLLLEKGTNVYLKAKPDSGMQCAQQSLVLSRKIHFQGGEVRALALISTYLSQAGDLPGALRMSFEALPLAIKINDKRTIMGCYNNMGLVYSTLKDYKKSLFYIRKVKDIAEGIKNTHWETIALNNISKDYLDNHKPDSALYFTQKGYAIALKTHDSFSFKYLIRNFGIIQFEKGNYKSALIYYKKSIQNIPGMNDYYLLSEDYRRIAEVFQHTNKIDSAIYYSKKALEDAKTDKSPELVLKATSQLTNLFRSVNNYDEVFKYQQIMLTAQDSLFSQQKNLQIQNLTFTEEQRRQEIEAAKIAYQNNVRLYSLLSVLGVLILIASILFYNNQRKKKANELLQLRNEKIETQRRALEQTLTKLKTTQTQLIQSEKMASLGELTAGIAHEIQNPLNFVNNFSEVNTELIDELQAERKNPTRDIKNEDDLLNYIKENEKKINMHGKRADAIVKGMLEHSRSRSGQKEPTDINAMADECMRISYHGLCAKDKAFSAELVTHFDPALPKIEVVPQDIGRVLLNLFNNAFYAVNQKLKTAGADYKPGVSVTTSAADGKVTIKVRDNGIGIPDAIKDKIMQPFFTTKPTGEGTGLGLSLTYDMVVKGHGGTIELKSKEGEGSEFLVKLAVG